MPQLKKPERGTHKVVKETRDVKLSEGMHSVYLFTKSLRDQVSVIIQDDSGKPDFGRVIMVHIVKGCDKRITLTLLNDQMPDVSTEAFENAINGALTFHKRDGACTARRRFSIF